MVRENRANSTDRQESLKASRPIRCPVNGGLHKFTCCLAAASGPNNDSNNNYNASNYNNALVLTRPTRTIWNSSRISPSNREGWQRGRSRWRTIETRCNEERIIASPTSPVIGGLIVKPASLSCFRSIDSSGSSSSSLSLPSRESYKSRQANLVVVSNNATKTGDLITTKKRPQNGGQPFKKAAHLVTLLLALLLSTDSLSSSTLVEAHKDSQHGRQQQQQQQQQQLVNGAARTGNRVLRQISSSESSVLNDKNVPYKTFYVTRACEWKSNLFVPKSNDIHFAQSWPSLTATNIPLETGQNGAQEAGGSSVVYETFNANSYQQQQQQPFGALNSPATRPFGGYQQLHSDSSQDQSRTMLSTNSKALVLALPIVISQTFAGYEPACSIRLIVPRNMRILAKLSSRRLTFEQQQLNEYSEPVAGEPVLERRPTRILWLNVSQNQFIETEHKTIETEGNVLAFRFLLERSANKLVPDTRFQVVLTAFQTLSDNSDLSSSGQQTATAFGGQQPFVEPQFICDQQRLISANLACDGFKNCQDGHDEESATCLALRTGTRYNGNTGSDSTNPQNTDLTSKNQQFSSDNNATDQQQRGNMWTTRIWNLARETNSLAGFLLGFLLMLLLLICCSCCTYLIYLIWRRYWLSRPTIANNSTQFRSAGRREQLAEEHEADSLAAASNSSESRSKQFIGSLLPPTGGKQIPARLQSILKKPGPFGGASEGRPAAPPPAVPARARSSGGPITGASRDSPSRRGALSSSLSSGAGQQVSQLADQFKPTPARRLTRPTRPVPVPVSVASEQVSQQQQHLLLKQHQQRQQQQQLARSRTTTQTTTSSTTGTQRVTTYHYSSGSTRISESYLQRLAEQSRPATTTTTTTTTAASTAATTSQPRSPEGTRAPSRDQKANYPTDSSASPRASLI